VYNLQFYLKDNYMYNFQYNVFKLWCGVSQSVRSERKNTFLFVCIFPTLNHSSISSLIYRVMYIAQRVS
jgi:hypothetical protein